MTISDEKVKIMSEYLVESFDLHMSMNCILLRQRLKRNTLEKNVKFFSLIGDNR